MNSVDTLASRCLADLQLDTAELDGEYGYAHLPLCIIDAVWSIGVRYSGVQNVIARYRSHFRLHAEFACSPHTIDIMLREMDNEGALWFAREVFQNMQRTSTRGGILKAEAIHKFAGVLQRHGMNTLEDVPKILWYEDLDREIAKPYAQELLGIPGQRSGISLSYFYMLTGSSGLIKPDRMVKGYLKDVLGKVVSDPEAQYLISLGVCII